MRSRWELIDFHQSVDVLLIHMRRAERALHAEPVARLPVRRRPCVRCKISNVAADVERKALPLCAEVAALAQSAEIVVHLVGKIRADVAARLEPAQWAPAHVHAADEALDELCSDLLKNVSGSKARIPHERLTERSDVRNAGNRAREAGARQRVDEVAVDI